MTPGQRAYEADVARKALPESPLERAKRLSRTMVDVDSLVGITERVPWQSWERGERK
jgi:hypothetical protein